MSVGLIALLDDVVGLAKVAAASLDDVATQAAGAGVKAVGVVVDDTAVTPRYVMGIDARRELPMIGRIALGSIRNKLLYLLPGALVFSVAAPWGITPVLMLGGAYLSYEGSEKVFHSLRRHEPARTVAADDQAADPNTLEDRKVRSAIQTDLILSAEIMAVTLGSVAASTIWVQAAVLAVVGVGITALVYGVVALIVKADDAGLALARADRPISGLFGKRPPAGEASRADRVVRRFSQGAGRGMVTAMPSLLRGLGVIGTAAMTWVGGGILIHGLEVSGIGAPAHAIERLAAAAGHSLPAVAALAEWTVGAAASGIFGLAVGAAMIPIMTTMVEPLRHRFKRVKQPADRKPDPRD